MAILNDDIIKMLFETEGDHWTHCRQKELLDLTWAKAEELEWATTTGIHNEFVNDAINAFSYADRLKEYFYHRHQLEQEMTDGVIRLTPVSKYSYRKALFWKEQAQKYKKMIENFNFSRREYVKPFDESFTIEPMTKEPQVLHLHVLKNRESDDIRGRATYDCEYGSGITCEECICNGGDKDP